MLPYKEFEGMRVYKNNQREKEIEFPSWWQFCLLETSPSFKYGTIFNSLVFISLGNQTILLIHLPGMIHSPLVVDADQEYNDNKYDNGNNQHHAEKDQPIHRTVFPLEIQR